MEAQMTIGDWQRGILRTDLKEDMEVRDCYAIPFEEIIRSYPLLEPASHERMMFLMLAGSGCRISELDNMKVTGLRGNRLYWNVGKNQRGTRYVDLPDWYIEEYKAYRSRQDYKFSSSFFGIKKSTFCRDFDKRIRPMLGGGWTLRTQRFDGFRWKYGGYKYQLKGFRKAYVTHRFYREWDKLNSAGAAIEMVCRDMHHSSKGMTVSHYIEDGEKLNMRSWAEKSIWEIIKGRLQMCLTAF